MFATGSTMFGAASTPAFGAPASTPSLFGSTSTPAFGASSAPAFGFTGASSSAFGASSGSGFSFGSAPASSAASTFSFNSTPAAAASSSASLFGSTTTTSFGTGASAPSAFGAASTPSMFGSAAAPATGSTFSFSSGFGAGSSALVPANTPSFLGGAAAAPQAPAQQQLTFSTRYDDLPDQQKKALDEIQRLVALERDNMQALQQVQRLHDSAALRKTHEEETKVLKSALQAELQRSQVDDPALAAFKDTVQALVASFEEAAKLYRRSIVIRRGMPGIKEAFPTTTTEEEARARYAEMVALCPPLPSAYLDKAVHGLRQQLEHYGQLMANLEQVAPRDLYSQLPSDAASLQLQLPTVISHLQDYLIKVAAQLERLHTQVARAKEACVRSRPGAASKFEQVRRQREYEAQQSAATPAIPVAKPGQQAAAGQQQAAAAAAPPSLFGTPGAAPAAAASPAAAGTPAPAFGAPSPQPFGGFGSAFGQTPQQNTLARSKSSTSGSGQRRKR